MSVIANEDTGCSMADTESRVLCHPALKVNNWPDSSGCNWPGIALVGER